MKRRYAIAICAALSACSSGSSTAPPVVRTTASPPASEPAVDAAIVQSRLALGALQADAALALLLGPGHLSPLLDPTVAFAPVCDATSATAQSVRAEVNATVMVVRTAIYAPGDTLCATAPEAISVVGYPAAAGTYPRTGYGYMVNYSLSPLTAIAVAGGGQGSAFPIYANYRDASTVDFATNFSLGVALPVVPPQTQAGTFPATFPSTFNDASAVVGAQIASTGIAFDVFDDSQYAAVLGTSGYRAGWLPFFGNLQIGQAATGASSSYALADTATFAFAPASGSASTLNATGSSPSFAVSRTVSDPARSLSTFPLAAGSTAFAVGTQTSVGERSTAANVTTQPTNTATFLSDGTIVAAHQTYADAVAQVSADLVTTDGTSLTLTIEDRLANASLTSPQSIALSTLGSSTYCTFSYTPFPFATGPRYVDEITNYYCPAASPAPMAKRR